MCIRDSLNAYAVAGIMGNLYAESGLMPNNLQNTYNNKLGKTDAEYTAAVDNGNYGNFVKDSAGYGLAPVSYTHLDVYKRQPMYLPIMISIMPMIKSINALIVRSRHSIGFFFCFFFLHIVPFLLSSGFASYLFLSPFHDFIIYQLWYIVNAFMQKIL